MEADIGTAIEQMREGKPELSEEALTALAEDALAPTPLGDIAALLKEAMKLNMEWCRGPLGAGQLPMTQRQLSINDKLAEALNIANALRGDGQ